MIKTLRESKAKLSELVELACRGEDTLITVRGEVKARLTGARARSPRLGGARWAGQLRTLHRKYGTGKQSLSIEEILAETREEGV
jgi:prevent-host-death family protein